MKIRETAIAKLLQLPEPLLQQVSDFIDLLTDGQHSATLSNPQTDNTQSKLTEAWAQWFEAVDRSEITPTEPVKDYHQLLLAKYRQQGLEL